MGKQVRVAIAGLGTVGSAVVRLLQENYMQLSKQCSCDLKLVAVSARDKMRERGLDLTGIKWYDDPVELAAAKDIDIFVELIGGDGVAKQAIEVALDAGHHVVSANKALLAHYGKSLAKRAEEKNLILNFEAAVAGGIPVIKVLHDSLIANNISQVYGILNGTCNYIFTRMAKEHLPFEECLREAQRLGYAEADPTFDIEGFDTAHKLTLLVYLAFGMSASVEDIYIEGISHISLADIRAAQELGYEIKLLAIAYAQEDGIELRVQPTLLPQKSSLAQVEGVTNAISLHTDLLGELFLSGPGAGGEATASAIISDIADIAKICPTIGYKPVFTTSAIHLLPYKAARYNKSEAGYFIRLIVEDRAGVFARVAQHFANENVSLKAINQRSIFDQKTEDRKMVVLVTHKTKEESVLKILQVIQNDGYLVEKPQMIRICDFM